MVSLAVGLLPMQIELLHSNEFDPAILRRLLHSMRLCRRSLNFALVPVSRLERVRRRRTPPDAPCAGTLRPRIRICETSDPEQKRNASVPAVRIFRALAFDMQTRTSLRRSWVQVTPPPQLDCRSARRAS